MDGKCGTGPDFCGDGVCQSGNCAAFAEMDKDTTLPWVVGTSKDGTCGGETGYTCGILYGNCCNKNGLCGSLPTDCGDGW